MNRTRLTREVNDIRLSTLRLLQESLGDWYDIRVFASSDHVADRLIDRSQSLKTNLKIVSDILASMANHYSCNLLYFLHDNNDLHRIVLYRKIDGKTFAVPITAKRMPPLEEGGKSLLQVVIRTVIPEYALRPSDKKIHIDYKYPKITFEYDGFRRVLSRLTKLVQSENCPSALKVLRVK